VVVRRRAVEIWPEAAQKVAFHTVTRPGGVRAGQPSAVLWPDGGIVFHVSRSHCGAEDRTGSVSGRGDDQSRTRT
jgi:hypothetical protein